MDKIAAFTTIKSKALKQSSVSDHDVVIIWNALSKYIQTEMLRKNGIKIPGFGTFTFVEQRLDVAQRTQIVRLKPYLMLSEKLLQTHSFKQNIEPINHAVPINLINYTQVNAYANNKYSREICETVLREAFTAMQHFLRRDGHIRVDFTGVGTFKVESNTLKALDVFSFIPAFTANIP